MWDWPKPCLKTCLCKSFRSIPLTSSKTGVLLSLSINVLKISNKGFVFHTGIHGFVPIVMLPHRSKNRNAPAFNKTGVSFFHRASPRDKFAPDLFQFRSPIGKKLSSNDPLNKWLTGSGHFILYSHMFLGKVSISDGSYRRYTVYHTNSEAHLFV